MKRQLCTFGLAAVCVLALATAGGAQKKGRGTTPPPDPGFVYINANKTRPYWGLMVANADGSNPKVLLSWVGDSSQPAFSPDGKSIVFNSRLNDVPGLYSIGADGSGLRLLAPLNNISPTSTDYYSRISWSPIATADGREKIAFVDRDAEEVNVINPDGTGRTSLLYLDAVTGVSWSPNATRLAVVSNASITLGAASVSIYALSYNPLSDRLEATLLNEIPFPGMNFIGCAWDPTGDRIAFSALVGSWYDLHTLDFNDPSSPVLRRLTSTSEASERTPCWAPDGSKIYFSRYEHGGMWGRYNVQAVSPDGTGLATVLSSALNADRRRF